MHRTRAYLTEVTSPFAERPITVADRIIARVAEHSDHVFGVGGANIEDLYDAVQHSAAPITGIVAKHEFGAATMADGYARATNRLGVVAATSGGGALNLIAALGESYDSRVPVLALVGQPPLAVEGRGAFQDTSGGAGRLDAERLFGSVARYCAKITEVGDLAARLSEAIAAALSGGPAVLLLPKDIQTAVAPDELEGFGPPVRFDAARQQSSAVPTGVAAGPGPVVIIAGPEIARAEARAELEVCAVAVGAKVLVTPDAKDAFANDHPLFGGVVGIMGHPHAGELIGDAAQVVLAGTAMPMLARAGLEAALASCPRVLHLGVEAPFVPVHERVPTPLGRGLLDLAAMLSAGNGTIPRIESTSIPVHRVPPASGPGVRYRDAVETIAARLEPGTDVVADAGNTGAAVVHHLPVPEDGRFLIALGMGGMGYAFGAGIGSALGRRRRTFVIAGDGAYFMHGHEVHTAVEHHVPVTFIVFNNNAHAMCVTREQLYFTGDYTFNRFGAARIGDSVAAMFPHLPAYATTTVAEFAAALDETRTVPGPVFIEIACDPDEIPPFAPFLKEFSA
ncbi:thiamine pyrophosphate-binding protein [Nocardia sp. GCM10030253]|uniref:thiamine pyrophosphate-binding protein n=1 Tax=Nocardia sp. GCM10030253 TaxID=3273404 RepID=UPI0036438EF3